MTFAQLAQTDINRLRTILQEAGPRFKMMVPDSWPEQAGLAAKGEWDLLKKLQDELDGGKYRQQDEFDGFHMNSFHFRLQIGALEIKNNKVVHIDIPDREIKSGDENRKPGTSCAA